MNGEVAKDVVVYNKPVSKRAIITTVILVYINLLNYMDRFTVSSVLPDIQKYFGNIDKIKAGLLQTVFVCAYMAFAPLFGYLGDRYSRKYLIAIGITIWSVTTFAGSCMGQNSFWGFFALRGFVGIGEASYSTVAPTIIADLFVGSQRSVALTIFYFAVPCGSGLGYIVGSKFSQLMNQWQWALRVTPVLGIIAVLFTVFAMHEPKRGAAECFEDPKNIDDVSESIVVEHPSSFIDDLRVIVHIPSFLWSTAGFTCISFVVGALAWWAPDFALYSLQKLKNNEEDTIQSVSWIFGIITFVAGVVGVAIGAEIARRWKKTNIKADSLVCAYGILGAIPFLFFALYIADKNQYLMWAFILIGNILMCMNWCPNGDLLLYVVPPKCRSTAEALQILLIHVLGDAFSPFVVGLISDAYTKAHPDDSNAIRMQRGLLYSLYITPFLCCFGTACYLICSRYVEEDKMKAEKELKTEIYKEYYSNTSNASFPNLLVNGDESQDDHKPLVV